MIVTRVSPRTGEANTMELDITDQQLMLIINKSKPIQEIVPHLTSDEREFLITGYTAQDWDILFPEEEE